MVEKKINRKRKKNTASSFNAKKFYIFLYQVFNIYVTISASILFCSLTFWGMTHLFVSLSLPPFPLYLSESAFSTLCLCVSVCLSLSVSLSFSLSFSLSQFLCLCLSPWFALSISLSSVTLSQCVPPTLSLSSLSLSL